MLQLADEDIDISICNEALIRIHQPRLTAINEDTPQARYCRLYYQSSLYYLLSMYEWTFARKVAPLSADTNSYVNIKKRHQERLNKLKEDGISDANIKSYLTYFLKEVHPYNYMYDCPLDLLRIIDLRVGSTYMSDETLNNIYDQYGADINSLADATANSGTARQERSIFNPSGESKMFEIGTSQFQGTDQTSEGDFNFSALNPDYANNALFKKRAPRTVIKTNFYPLTIEYIFVPKYSLFSPLFRETFVLDMALKMVIPLTNDKMLFQGIASLYSAILEQAKVTDAQQNIVQYYNNF